jgi:uncharacterized membrane protein (Fun14 family)
MVVPILTPGIETTLFSFSGGGILGVMAGMALKRIVKFAAIIVGLFVLGLAFFSYRGWITANWLAIESQTKNMAFNASAQVLQMVNDTASKFTLYPLLAHTEATPISAAIGFSAGFIFGLKH